MHKTMLEGASNVLNRMLLLKLTVKVVRSGVWFRALNKIDSVLVDFRGVWRISFAF